MPNHSGSPLASSSRVLETWIDGELFFDRDRDRKQNEEREAERIALAAEADALGADPVEIFDDTYETLPPDLVRQREAFLADVARRKGGE